MQPSLCPLFSRTRRVPRGALLVLLAMLVLPAAATAQAPGVVSAPVAFKNSTNQTLEIVCETVVNDFGEYPLSRVWTFKPGDFLYLTDNANQKILAKKINYTVRTPGKASRWNSVSPGPDVHGNFVAEFSQQNLQTHLGGVVVAGFRGGNGPTQQQMENAAVKIIVACVAHAIAKQAAEAPNAGFTEFLALQIAVNVRDQAIRSALNDLFPGLSPRQSTDLQRLISTAADGRLTLNNLDQQQAKQRLVADLQAIDPNLANVAVIADFIFTIHQMQQRNRR